MKPHLFKIELCLTFILGWHCTHAQTSSMQPKHVSVVSSTRPDSDHVYREIDLKMQKKVFKSFKGKKILINIYPVKKGKLVTNKDMQLAIFFQGVNGTMTDLSDKVNEKKFNEQSANYVSFVKLKHIPGKNIPNTYYASIDADRIAQADKIAFYLSISKSHLNYYLLSNNAPKRLNDSTGKCPPCNLSRRTLRQYDSTGKCPPMCNLRIPIHFNK